MALLAVTVIEQRLEPTSVESAVSAGPRLHTLTCQEEDTRSRERERERETAGFDV